MSRNLLRKDAIRKTVILTCVVTAFWYSPVFKEGGELEDWRRRPASPNRRLQSPLEAGRRTPVRAFDSWPGLNSHRARGVVFHKTPQTPTASFNIGRFPTWGCQNEKPPWTTSSEELLATAAASSPSDFCQQSIFRGRSCLGATDRRLAPSSKGVRCIFWNRLQRDFHMKCKI